MSLQYAKSKKGRDQLLYRGYLHTKERVFGNKTVWKCAIYHKAHCPGRAHTFEGRVIKYSAHHHPPGKAAREAKRIEQSTKTATPAGAQLSHKVVLPTSDGLLKTVPAKRPCIQNPKQTMQRLRECLSATLQGTCHSQTSATVAESVPRDPPSVFSVSPPNLHECSEGFRDGSSTARPMLREEPKASLSVQLQASQEARRKRFRSSTVPPGANPQEILSQISEAARQWLCPQEHDKDQIVDMVILEQFLAVLPVSMQAWVKAREPRSSMEAVGLAETYLKDQEPPTAGQELEKDLVTFEDVCLSFSEEEWALMDQGEKALYWNVMHQNYNNVAWLTGKGTGSKRGKDPWQEVSEPTVELLKNNNKEIAWGAEQDSIRANHLKGQSKSNSAEKDVSFFISGLKEIIGDAELDLETVHISCDGTKEEDSSSVISSRKCPREEDAEPTILSEELRESSEKKILQNPEENSIKEGQKDVERQQSNNPRVEDNLIPFRESLSDHQDSRPGQEILCMAVDGEDCDESLILLHAQSITIEDDLESLALPEGSLFISGKEISKSPEKDSQPEPIHVNSLSELNRTYSGEGVNGSAALISQKTIVLDQEQISRPEKEEGETKSILSGNGLPELTKEPLLLLHFQPTPEPQSTGPNPEESSEHNSSHKSSQGEDLSKDLSNKRQFIQSSASATQPTCFDSGQNSSSLSVLIKHRRFEKKRKPRSGRNMPVRSVLGTQWRISPGGKLHKHLNWSWWASRKWGCQFPEPHAGLRKHGSVNINAQPHETLQTGTEKHRTTSEAASSSDTREAKPWQRVPSFSLLDKMAADPIVAQLMAVLEQVAADTAEIKSAVSRLEPTMVDIQNALRNLSCSTVDAEQLVQHCNDIKAIEARLVGKTVQTNVIAGLWPSLGVKRKMSP